MAVRDKARAAKTMPWSEMDARMWQTIFPNMANWLPEEEANQLRFEFASGNGASAARSSS